MKLTTFCVLIFLSVTKASILTNSAAADKAVAFLWSQVDEYNYKWPEGEVASAILGLVSAKPPLQGGKFMNQTQQLIVDANMELMSADFLLKLLRPQEKASIGALSNIDIPTLIQYIGVLQVNCQNPRDYLGFDLVEEAVKRLDQVSNVAPTFGALMMTICNSDSENILKKQHFQNLVKSVPAIGHKCPFCIERSAMNILALACLVNKATDEDVEAVLPSVRALRGLIGRFSKYIDSVQEPNGGFGTLFATSLAIQAKLSTKVKSDFDIEAAWKNLKSAQKDDGSFGSSVTVTAIALPALTGQTAIDINRIPCPDPNDGKSDSPTIVIAYELEDLVFSQQKIRGHIVVARGITLLQALNNYSRENPTIFKLETETSSLGTRILSINEIKSDPAATTHWFVDAVHRNGKVVPISSSIASTAVEPSSVVVYRMSYKTAKLSL